MSGGRLPVIDPLHADAVGALSKLQARGVRVFHDNDNPGVELLSGVIDVR
jgi:hypothetical protein